MNNLLILKFCPSCKSKLEKEGIHLVCKNKSCSEQKIQQILYWCEKSEMEGVAESTIRSLYDFNVIVNIIDFYRLVESEYDFIKRQDGFGEKKTQNLREQIEYSKSMSTQEFVDRLGINLVGKKALKKLNINSLVDFWSFNDKQYKIGQNLIEYRNENKDFLNELIKLLNICDNTNKMNSKGNVCMTGKGHKGRKELIKDIESLDYTFIDSISKDTNILICEDVNGNSSKLVKAKKLGIELKTYEEFFK